MLFRKNIIRNQKIIAGMNQIGWHGKAPNEEEYNEAMKNF